MWKWHLTSYEFAADFNCARNIEVRDVTDVGMGHRTIGCPDLGSNV